MIRDYEEFCMALRAVAQRGNIAGRSPVIAFVAGFELALRIAAQRPDFALAYERLEDAAGITATGVDDVNGMVAEYLRELAIAPEVLA